MAQINATDIAIWFGETTTPSGAVGYSTNATLTISAEALNATTKDDGGWEKSLGGIRTWEITAEALADYTANENVETFFDAIANRTNTCRVIFVVGGTETYYGEAFVTSMDLSGEMETVATVSVTLKGSGALTTTEPAGWTP
jgi:predicted secreted protein